MTDNPAAFIVTETGQQKTFTVTYTFPDGAVEAATECCRRAGLTVIDTTDDATVQLVARTISEQGGNAGSGIHSWRCEYPDRYGNCDCVEQAARAILAALRGGAA